jgi:hypothetical protein
MCLVAHTHHSTMPEGGMAGHGVLIAWSAPATQPSAVQGGAARSHAVVQMTSVTLLDRGSLQERCAATVPGLGAVVERPQSHDTAEGPVKVQWNAPRTPAASVVMMIADLRHHTQHGVCNAAGSTSWSGLVLLGWDFCVHLAGLIQPHEAPQVPFAMTCLRQCASSSNHLAGVFAAGGSSGSSSSSSNASSNSNSR